MTDLEKILGEEYIEFKSLWKRHRLFNNERSEEEFEEFKEKVGIYRTLVFQSVVLVEEALEEHKLKKKEKK